MWNPCVSSVLWPKTNKLFGLMLCLKARSEAQTERFQHTHMAALKRVTLNLAFSRCRTQLWALIRDSVEWWKVWVWGGCNVRRGAGWRRVSVAVLEGPRASGALRLFSLVLVCLPLTPLSVCFIDGLQLWKLYSSTSPSLTRGLTLVLHNSYNSLFLYKYFLNAVWISINWTHKYEPKASSLILQVLEMQQKTPSLCGFFH